MELNAVRISRAETEKFQLRASSFYPLEIEDYLIGTHRRRGWEVKLILPTRIGDIDVQGRDTIGLKEIAATRAAASAEALGLEVLGSVHTHPYQAGSLGLGGAGCGGGPMLSQADHDGFPAMRWMKAPPLIGVCAVYRIGKHPDKWQYWWSFWREGSPLTVPFRYSRARLR